MKIRICAMNGVEFTSMFNPESTVDNLKVVALSNFFGPGDSMKDAIYHKIVLVRTGKSLDDEKTLQQQDVVENGKLLSFDTTVHGRHCVVYYETFNILCLVSSSNVKS